MGAIAKEHHSCSRCGRVPLVGERVYVVDEPLLLCELCRAPGHDPPPRSRVVHGPAFGQMIRILDRRAA